LKNPSTLTTNHAREGKINTYEKSKHYIEVRLPIEQCKK